MVFVQFLDFLVELPATFTQLLSDTTGIEGDSLLVTLLCLQLFVLWILLRPNLPIPMLLVFFASSIVIGIGIECRVVFIDTVFDLGHEYLYFILELSQQYPFLNELLALCNSFLVVGGMLYIMFRCFQQNRWNLLVKGTACICCRMFIGMTTRLPLPPGFVPVEGDWPPTNDTCRGFIFNPSGHVLGMTLLTMEFLHGGETKFAFFTIILNLLQAIRLIALRGHYSVDVITAVLIAYSIDPLIERRMMRNSEHISKKKN